MSLVGGNDNSGIRLIERLSAKDVKFYGLLYIDERYKQQTNLKSRDDDVITTYLKCASLTHRSFEAKGLSFALITNDAAGVMAKLKTLELNDLNVLGCSFTRDVPDGIRFYAAHFKLDLFSEFARGSFGDRIGLIDIDTVLIREFDPELLFLDGFIAYDITDQVKPRYGIDLIRRDLELVAGAPLQEPRWFGGELIVGHRRHYEALSHVLFHCWNSYKHNHNRLHHSGDEMIVSAALALLRRDGYEIIDGGQLMAVSRWWTARTFHSQSTFRIAKQASLLHLPSDKRFLASLPNEAFDSDSFIKCYTAYARKKLMFRKFVNRVESPFSREKRYVGSLS